MKLKDGGRKEKEELKVKKFISKTGEINVVLNLLRSSAMFESMNIKHEKCAVSQFCNFCLLRSSIYRINLQKGRQTLTPVELECQPFKSIDQSFVGVLENVLENAIMSCSSFKNEIIPQWECSCCTSLLKSSYIDFIIQLDNATTDREISNLIEMKYNSL